MIWLKACPRCKQGDMCPDEDDTRLCLHCGYVQYRKDDSALRLRRFLGLDAADEEPLASTVSGASR